MEFLREEEKKEDTETATSRIGIIEVESSEKNETATQDLEVSQPVEGWTEQERKVSWVDRIKTIGKIQYWIYIIPPDI